MAVPTETLPSHLKGRVIWYLACTRLTGDSANRRHIFVCRSKDEALGLTRNMDDVEPATAHVGRVPRQSRIDSITTHRPIHLSDPHGLLA